MKAMVLAAGFGRRLQPLTREIPKPALPVLGRPLIQQVLGNLGRQGCTEVTVNLHHLPGSLAPLLADPAIYGLERLHLSLEEERILGTGGGIRKAAPHLRGSGTFLVRNSDFLLDINLQEAVAQHYRSGRMATLVLTGTRPGYTPVPVDGEGRILSFGNLRDHAASAVASTGLFTGLHIAEEELLDRIPGDGPCDIVRDVYLPLLDDGAVGAVHAPGFWWEFGTPRQYLEGSMRIIDLAGKGDAGLRDIDTVKELGGARVALGPGAVVSPGARLSGRLAVGMAAALSGGCRVEDSLILPEAWIGADADLRECIIGPKVELPAGSVLRRKLVCRGADQAVVVRDLDG